MKNGRIIHISEDETIFSKVEKVVNGEVVRQQRVYTDDLLDGLFGMLTAPQQLKFLLEQHDFIQFLLEVMKGRIKAKDFSSIMNRLSHVYDGSEENKLSVVTLLTNLVEHFKDKDVEMDEAVYLYKNLSIALKGLEDVEAKKSLFLHLLNTLNVSSDVSKDFMGEIVGHLLRIKTPETLDFIGKCIERQSKRNIICSSPILPPNTVVYREDNHGGYTLAIKVEAMKRDVFFFNTEFKNVGHPHLLFIFNVSENKTASAKLFAVKDSRIKENTKLYHYPFANVHDNGLCCWPELDRIPINDPIQLENMVELFFNSPNSNHLFRGQNLREVFSNFSEKEFNVKQLKPFGTTFGNLLQLEQNKLKVVETA